MRYKLMLFALLLACANIYTGIHCPLTGEYVLWNDDSINITNFSTTEAFESTIPRSSIATTEKIVSNSTYVTPSFEQFNQSNTTKNEMTTTSLYLETTSRHTTKLEGEGDNQDQVIINSGNDALNQSWIPVYILLAMILIAIILILIAICYFHNKYRNDVKKQESMAIDAASLAELQSMLNVSNDDANVNQNNNQPDARDMGIFVAHDPLLQEI